MPPNNPMTEGEALAVIDLDRTVAAAEFRAHCYQLVDLVEGPRCLRWQDARGFRLKDTDEWVRFYVAVKAMQRLAGPDPYVALTAHTAASGGEVGEIYEATDQDGRPYRGVFWADDSPEPGTKLYTAPPAAVPADALERLSHAQASIRGLIAEIDPARKPATGELKLIADQLRDTLAALIPKGADHV